MCNKVKRLFFNFLSSISPAISNRTCCPLSCLNVRGPPLTVYRIKKKNTNKNLTAYKMKSAFTWQESLPPSPPAQISEGLPPATVAILPSTVVASVEFAI